VIVICDQAWLDPDLDARNGILMANEKDMLRLDSMIMMCQLNVREILEVGIYLSPRTSLGPPPPFPLGSPPFLHSRQPLHPNALQILAYSSPILKDVTDSEMRHRSFEVGTRQVIRISFFFTAMKRKGSHDYKYDTVVR
jgi:hypothetical protein